MSQEERAALTEKTTQRLVACLHQTEGVEQMIRSMLTGSGIAMFAVGGHTTEEWISRTVASLLIPMFITRTLPEGEGAQEPIVASHWHTRDLEGDAVTCASGLEQALTYVLHQQRPSLCVVVSFVQCVRKGLQRDQCAVTSMDDRFARGGKEEGCKQGKWTSRRPFPHSRGKQRR